MQSLPRLEGSIDHLPEKLYAGDLRYLVLELKNSSESPIKVVSCSHQPLSFILFAVKPIYFFVCSVTVYEFRLLCFCLYYLFLLDDRIVMH